MKTHNSLQIEGKGQCSQNERVYQFFLETVIPLTNYTGEGEDHFNKNDSDTSTPWDLH